MDSLVWTGLCILHNKRLKSYPRGISKEKGASLKNRNSPLLSLILRLKQWRMGRGGVPQYGLVTQLS